MFILAAAGYPAAALFYERAAKSEEKMAVL